jgi:hypothetical protein
VARGAARVHHEAAAAGAPDRGETPPELAAKERLLAEVVAVAGLAAEVAGAVEGERGLRLGHRIDRHQPAA